jgi:hypothetical protein
MEPRLSIEERSGGNDQAIGVPFGLLQPRIWPAVPSGIHPCLVILLPFRELGAGTPCGISAIYLEALHQANLMEPWVGADPQYWRVFAGDRYER